jgi:hypothetical protein
MLVGLGRSPVSVLSRKYVRIVVLYVQVSRFAPHRSLLPLRIFPQGSRGFYIRAYRASLPLQAPDMLSVRIEAIDTTR